MKYNLEDLIDMEHFQNLQDRLNEIYSFPSAIIDNNGIIHTATAWQDICTQFHRKNKDTEKLCIKSDQYIKDHIHEANPAVSYRCPHGLVDNATPIIIDGFHYGNFFTGQFFLEEPDMEFFSVQAEKYGFDEDAYLKAVKRVPIWTQEQLTNYLFFIKGLIAVIAESGLKKLKAIENRNIIEANEKRHRSILKSAMDGYWLTDTEGRLLEVNDAYCRMSGYNEDELLTMYIPALEANEKPQLVAEHMQKVILQGSDRFESKHRRKDGTVFEVEVSVQFRPEEGGQCVCFFRDVTERKQAGEVLKESEEKYRYTLESMPDAIHAINSDYNITLCNSKFRELAKNMGFGDDFVGSNLFECFPFLEGLIHSEYEQVFKNGIPLTTEEVQTLNDETLITETRKIPIYKEKDVISIVTVIRDITKQRNALAALKESEERFELAMRFSNDGVYDWDLETNKIHYSSGWKRMLGYEDNEIKSDLSEWERLTKPEDAKIALDMVNELLEGKRNRFEIEFQMLHKDGHWVDILSRANVIFNKHGKGIRIVGTHVDISAHKSVEKELIKERDRSQRYLDLAGVIFVAIDGDQNVILINNKGCEVLGYSEDEIIGKNWFDNFLPKAGIQEVKGVYNELISGNIKPVKYYENLVVAKDGSEKLIAWHNTFVRDDFGHIISILSSGEDITERKLLESQLQQAHKMESIGTLASGIAHDLNNILSPIMVHSELATMDLPYDSPAQHNLKEIFKAGERARDMVKQILAFSRKGEGERAKIKITPILREVLKMLRSSIPTTINIQQNLEVESDTILADPTHVHQIMLNLATNAAHAMREKGGILEVSLVQEDFDPITAEQYTDLSPGPYLKLTVRDTGHGIDDETMKKIFEPYFTTKEVGEGTGMGLALVHGIVKSYGGDITVESELGDGTTFNVYLPSIGEEVSSNEKHSSRIPKGSESILLVDDEKSILDTIQSMLESLGYKVTVRNSSIEALEVFKNNPDRFDLVITDMTMPNMTGKDLAKEMMAIRKGIPIILCTGFSNQIDEGRAKEMGINAYLMKPIVMGDMANTIREVLDKK